MIDTKESFRHAANDAADNATHNCTDGPCRSLTIPRTAFDASGDALGLGRYGKQDGDGNSGGSDLQTANHGSSYGGGSYGTKFPSKPSVPQKSWIAGVIVRMGSCSLRWRAIQRAPTA